MSTTSGFAGQLGKALLAKRGLTFAVAIALIILLGLGTWQLTRLQWKLHLIHELERTQTLPPIPITEALSATASQAWHPVNQVACRIDPSRIVYMHGILDAKPGYHLITACPLGDKASALIVDLGFSEQKPLNLPPTDTVLTGRLRTFDPPNSFTPPNNPQADDWYWRTPSDLANRFGVKIDEAYFLSVDLKASGINIAGLSQGPVTVELPNRHLEYALTWYGLAMVMLCFFAVMIYRQMRLGVTDKA